MFQSHNNQSVHQDPDPEVVPRAKRRQYSETYKKQTFPKLVAKWETFLGATSTSMIK
jgi:hypothetical protein